MKRRSGTTEPNPWRPTGQYARAAKQVAPQLVTQALLQQSA